MKLTRLVFYGLAALIIYSLLAILLPVRSGGGYSKKTACYVEELDLGTALKSYHDKYSYYPTGQNSNIVRVLTGDNPQKTVFLNFRQYAEHPNEIVDPWKTPYQIEFFQQTNFVIRSAGKDKIFGDADDIVFNSISNDFVRP